MAVVVVAEAVDVAEDSRCDWTHCMDFERARDKGKRRLRKGRSCALQGVEAKGSGPRSVCIHQRDAPTIGLIGHHARICAVSAAFGIVGLMYR